MVPAAFAARPRGRRQGGPRLTPGTPAAVLLLLLAAKAGAARAPVLASVKPGYASLYGGTRFSVAGTNLYGTADAQAPPAVFVGPHKCEPIAHLSSPERVVCDVPPRETTGGLEHNDGVSVVVAPQDGVTPPGSKCCVRHRTNDSPELTRLYPRAGPPGSTTRLVGYRWSTFPDTASKVATMMVGGAACTLSDELNEGLVGSIGDERHLRCDLPNAYVPNTAAANVTLTTNGNGGAARTRLLKRRAADGTLADFTFHPVIEAVEPATGTAGTRLTVRGRGFVRGATKVLLHNDIAPCRIESVTEDQVVCTIGPLRSVSAQRALARAQLNLTSFHGTGDAVPNPAPVGGRGVLYEWWDDLKGDALWHQNKKGNLEKFIASGRPIVEGNPMFESGNATYGWQVLTDEFAAPRMVGCAGNKFSGVGKSMEYCTSHFVTFFRPPVSGTYSFFVSADDRAQLFLAELGEPGAAVLPPSRRIVATTRAVSERQLGKYDSQESEPITLDAGKHYMLEAFHAQWGGSTGLAIGARVPSERAYPDSVAEVAEIKLFTRRRGRVYQCVREQATGDGKNETCYAFDNDVAADKTVCIKWTDSGSAIARAVMNFVLGDEAAEAAANAQQGTPKFSWTDASEHSSFAVTLPWVDEADLPDGVASATATFSGQGANSARCSLQSSGDARDSDGELVVSRDDTTVEWVWNATADDVQSSIADSFGIASVTMLDKDNVVKNGFPYVVTGWRLTFDPMRSAPDSVQGDVAPLGVALETPDGAAALAFVEYHEVSKGSVDRIVHPLPADWLTSPVHQTQRAYPDVSDIATQPDVSTDEADTSAQGIVRRIAAATASSTDVAMNPSETPPVVVEACYDDSCQAASCASVDGCAFQYSANAASETPSPSPDTPAARSVTVAPSSAAAGGSLLLSLRLNDVPGAGEATKAHEIFVAIYDAARGGANTATLRDETQCNLVAIDAPRLHALCLVTAPAAPGAYTVEVFNVAPTTGAISSFGTAAWAVTNEASAFQGAAYIESPGTASGPHYGSPTGYEVAPFVLHHPELSAGNYRPGDVYLAPESYLDVSPLPTQVSSTPSGGDEDWSGVSFFDAWASHALRKLTPELQLRRCLGNPLLAGSEGTAATATSMQCTLPPLAQGEAYALIVPYPTAADATGDAEALGSGALVVRNFAIGPSLFDVTSVAPPNGAIAGGTDVHISGRGLYKPEATAAVYVRVPVSTTFPNGIVPCDVRTWEATKIVCRTRRHYAANAAPGDPWARQTEPLATQANNVSVVLCANARLQGSKGWTDLERLHCWGDANTREAACASDSCAFAYSDVASPQVTSISPQRVEAGSDNVIFTLGGMRLNLLGAGSVEAKFQRIGAGVDEKAVTCVGDTIDPSGASITCRMGAPLRTGEFSIALESTNGMGHAVVDASVVQATPIVAGVDMAFRRTGSLLGGTELVISGSGFDPEDTTCAVGVLYSPTVVVRDGEVTCTVPRALAMVKLEYWQVSSSFNLPLRHEEAASPFPDFAAPSRAPDGDEIVDLMIDSKGAKSNAFNIDWAGRAAYDGGPRDHFVARAKAFVRFPVSGNWSLWGEGDDDLLVYVDEVLASRAKCCNKGGMIYQKPPSLIDAGTIVEVVATLKEHGGVAHMRLYVQDHSMAWNKGEASALPLHWTFGVRPGTPVAVSLASGAVEAVEAVPIPTFSYDSGFDDGTYAELQSSGGARLMISDEDALVVPLLGWSFFAAAEAGELATLRVGGTFLGGSWHASAREDAAEYSCTLSLPANASDAADAYALCTNITISHGTYDFTVTVPRSIGSVWGEGEMQRALELSSVEPAMGSVHGGTVLTIHGKGFGESAALDDDDQPQHIRVGGRLCPTLTWSPESIACRIPYRAESRNQDVWVTFHNAKGNQIKRYGKRWKYHTDATPVIKSHSPETAAAGFLDTRAALPVKVELAMPSDGTARVPLVLFVPWADMITLGEVDDAAAPLENSLPAGMPCSKAALTPIATNSSDNDNDAFGMVRIDCSLDSSARVGGLPAGEFQVVVLFDAMGYAASDSTFAPLFTVPFQAIGIAPLAGSAAGGTRVTLFGLGFGASTPLARPGAAEGLTAFDMAHNAATIGGLPCSTVEFFSDVDTVRLPDSVDHSTITTQGFAVEAMVCLTANFCTDDVCEHGPKAVSYTNAWMPGDFAVSFTERSLGAYETTEELTPVVTSLYPKQGSTEGGTTVTIKGRRMMPACTPAAPGAPSPCALTVVSPLTGKEVGACTGLAFESDKVATCTMSRPSVPASGVESSDGSGVFGVVVLTLPGQVPTLLDPNATAVEARDRDETYTWANLWSSRTTWGGAEPPLYGESVSIPKNTTVVLDITPPPLGFVAIEGTLRVQDFGAGSKLGLTASHIVINGGAFLVGSRAKPHLGDFDITLTGRREDTAAYLPVYGSKVLAVRGGKFDVFGQPMVRTFTRLHSTAAPGDTCVQLSHDVATPKGERSPWQMGMEIAIGSGVPSVTYGIERRVISRPPTLMQDGTTQLCFAEGLEYRHNGNIITHAVAASAVSSPSPLPNEGEFHRADIPTEVDARVPVALLSRNVRIRGDETSSREKFGVHIMVHKGGNASPYPRADLHLSHVEISQSGQAGILGRYSLHFHVERFVNGTIGVADPEEYGHPSVEGCSFHDTFSRAIAIHNTHGVRVADNVAVNIAGHAYFLEDGSEIDNVFDGNLAMGVRSQHRLLWTDTTPAGFWITNANNTFVNNVAYNSEAYGFWFDLDASAPWNGRFTPCPTKTRLKIFDGNTANANVKYGLRVHPEWFPSDSCNSKAALVPTTLSNFTGVQNGMEGAIATQVGSVGFHRFALSDNGYGGSRSASKVNGKDNGGNVEFTWVSDGRPLNKALEQHDPRAYSGLFDSLVVASTPSFWEQDQDDAKKPAMFRWPSARKHAGITTQTRASLLFLDHVTFVNYKSSAHPGNGPLAAFEACGKCKANQGGFLTPLSAIQYVAPSTPAEGLQLHGRFAWKHLGVFLDRDGSAFGKGANGAMLAHNGLLPASACESSPSGMRSDGAMCTGAVSHRRVMLNSHGPSSIKFYPLRFTKFTGSPSASPVSDSVPFSKYNDQGYQMNVPAGVVYNVDWVTPARVDANQFRLHGWDSQFDGDWVVLRSEQQRRYDHFQVKVNGKSIVKEASPAVEAALLRAYTRSIGGGDSMAGLSEDDAPNGAHAYVDIGVDDSPPAGNTSDAVPHTALSLFQRGASSANVDVKAQECPQDGCPPPPPPPFVVGNGTVLWTDPSLWPSGVPPGDGEDAYIAEGWDVLLNVDTPKLRTLTVAGNLTFLSRGSNAAVTLYANRVVVDRGGRLEAGTDAEPFEGRVRILLHGTRATRGVDDAVGDAPVEIRDAASPASKALSVFGTLSLVAKVPDDAPRYLSVVEQTNTYIDVEGDGADRRITGDFAQQVWLSPSGFNPRTHEFVRVTTAEALGNGRHRLYLAEAPKHARPEAAAPPVGEGTLAYQPEAAFVDSTIVIAADDGPAQLAAETERFGCHVASFGNDAMVRLHGVTLDHCGQQGLLRPALALTGGAEGAYSVSDVALINNLDGGVLLKSTRGARLVNAATVLSLDWANVEVAGSRGGNRVERVLAGGLQKFSAGKSKFDKDLPALFQLTELVDGDAVKDTVAAGSDRLGYRYAGANVCDPHVHDGGAFENAVAHAVLVGMMLEARSGAQCSRVAHLAVHHAWDFGLIGMGITANAVISDSSFFDTKHAGVHVMRAGSFTDAKAAALMHNVHFGGDSASRRGGRGVCSCAAGGYNDEACLFPNPSSQSYPLRTTKVVGLMASSFALDFAPGPEQKPWDKVMGYPLVHGYTHVNVSSFYDFHDDCEGISVDPIAYHLATTPDAAHPVHLHGAALVNSTATRAVDFPAAPSKWRSPDDCGEDVWEPTNLPLNCNGPGHGLVLDHDGGLLGDAPMQMGFNAIPRPRVHQGTAFGQLYDANLCAPLENGQGHACKDVRAAGGATALSADPPTPIVLESRDADREERSNGVLQLHSWDSSMDGQADEPVSYGPTDLLVATMDHGWCAAYTCQKRLAAYWSTVQMDRDYKANFTGTPPGMLRVWMPTPPFVEARRDGSSILLTIPYRDKLRRFAFVPGRGRLPEADRKPSRDGGRTGLAFFWDARLGQATLLLPSGTGPVEIRTEAVVKLSLKLSLSVDEFFETDNGRFASNLATVLGIDPSRVRVVSVIPGSVVLAVEIVEDDSVLLADKEEEDFTVETVPASPPPPFGGGSELPPPPPPPPPPVAGPSSAGATAVEGSLQALAEAIVSKAENGELGTALGADVLALEVEVEDPTLGNATDAGISKPIVLSFAPSIPSPPPPSSSGDSGTALVAGICGGSALVVFLAAAFYYIARRRHGDLDHQAPADVEKARHRTVQLTAAASPQFQSKQDLGDWQRAVAPNSSRGTAGGSAHEALTHVPPPSAPRRKIASGADGAFAGAPEHASIGMADHASGVPSIARATNDGIMYETPNPASTTYADRATSSLAAGGEEYRETENPAANTGIMSTPRDAAAYGVARTDRSGSVDPTTPSAVLFDSGPFGPPPPHGDEGAAGSTWRRDHHVPVPTTTQGEEPRGLGRPAAPAAYASADTGTAYKRINPLAMGGADAPAKLPPPPAVPPPPSRATEQGLQGMAMFQQAAKQRLLAARFKSAALPRPPPGVNPPPGPPPPPPPIERQVSDERVEASVAQAKADLAAGEAAQAPLVSLPGTATGAGIVRQNTDERVEASVAEARAELALQEAAAARAPPPQPAPATLDRQRSALSQLVADQLGVESPPDQGGHYAGVGR